MTSLFFTVPPLGIARNDDDSSHHNEFINCTHCQLEFSDFQVSSLTRANQLPLIIISIFSLSSHQSLKDHIVQVHQTSAASPTLSMNGMAQHFSPPPSLLSPGNFPYHMHTGANEGGRQSHSPNTHACSYNQCSASFPTLELLEKHEMIQHSSGATNVVSLVMNFLVIDAKALLSHKLLRSVHGDENIPFF